MLLFFLVPKNHQRKIAPGGNDIIQIRRQLATTIIHDETSQQL
jgi:hypothetical protein